MLSPYLRSQVSRLSQAPTHIASLSHAPTHIATSVHPSPCLCPYSFCSSVYSVSGSLVKRCMFDGLIFEHVVLRTRMFRSASECILYVRPEWSGHFWVYS